MRLRASSPLRYTIGGLFDLSDSLSIIIYVAKVESPGESVAQCRIVDEETSAWNDDLLDRMHRTGLVRDLLNLLGDRERTVLELRFGLTGGQPMTLDQIGMQFGVKRERIRQIECKAMQRLRDSVPIE